MHPVWLVVLLALPGCASPDSQARSDTGSGWRTRIMPYLWVPSVSGASTDPEDPDDSEDVDGTSALSFLDGVFMFAAETGPAEGPLRVGIDSAWVSFEDQRPASTFGLDAAITELSVYGRIPVPLQLEAYAGARRVAADVSVSTSRRASTAGEDWWDPLVGLRLTSGNGEELSGWVSADIGGFDVGSRLAFELQAEAAWAFHDNVALVGGWRLLDVDYDRGGFRLDVQLRGLYLGLAVTF